MYRGLYILYNLRYMGKSWNRGKKKYMVTINTFVFILIYIKTERIDR